jgi:hypothetical protein
MVLMKDCTASLLTHPTGVADDAAGLGKPRQRCQCLVRKDRLNGE